MSPSRSRRLGHLILWRIFSTIRRLVAAPLIVLVLEDLSQLPEVALALSLGPLAAPLAVEGVLALEWWVWYVVLVAWVADMAYLAYFGGPSGMCSRVSTYLSTVSRNASAESESDRAANQSIAADGGHYE